MVLLREWHDVDDLESLKYLWRYLMRKKDEDVAFWTRKFLGINEGNIKWIKRH